VSDIDTVVVDSLKALDPEWPIREADIVDVFWHFRVVPTVDIPILPLNIWREAKKETKKTAAGEARFHSSRRFHVRRSVKIG